MGRLGRITLEDIVNGLTRYVPGVLTAGAILAVVTLLPGKPDKTDMSAPTLSGRTPGEQSSPTTTTSAPNNTTSAANTVGPSATTTASRSSGSASSSQDTQDSQETYRSGPAFTPSGGSASSAGTTPDGASDESGPLYITATAWASRTAPTPVASQGVPEGTLPVGTRVGQDDKRSFIRLEGTESALVLIENEEGARAPAAGEAAVRACKITDAGWEEGEAQSFSDAPAYDEEVCVDGTRGDDGRWDFDLSGIDSPADDKGIALVPGAEAPVDFQVAFEPFAATT